MNEIKFPVIRIRNLNILNKQLHNELMMIKINHSNSISLSLCKSEVTQPVYVTKIKVQLTLKYNKFL